MNNANAHAFELKLCSRERNRHACVSLLIEEEVKGVGGIADGLVILCGACAMRYRTEMSTQRQQNKTAQPENVPDCNAKHSVKNAYTMYKYI